MKSTGIVRKIDDLGRFVIPKELRTTLHIKEDSPLEIFTDGDMIVLKKFELGCIICDEKEESRLIDVKGKKICIHCLNEGFTSERND